MRIPSILIIDDNDGDRLLAQLAIEDANATEKIFFSKDGQEAIDFLLDENNKEIEGDKFPPALIFLDINMPRMNGFEFLQEYEKLKKDKHYECVVICMLTSSLNPKDIERSNKFSSVKNFYPKPLTEEMVLKIISEIT